MQGFCDQIARQYDTLVAQTTISSGDLTTPTRTDLTNRDSWLEFAEFSDETIVPTNNSATTRSAESGIEHFKMKISFILVLFLVEALCIATEENNKKNATNDGSEQRILIENDMNSSVPNLSSTNIASLNILTTTQSSPNLTLTTPTTINLTNIPIIDDETTSSDQQQKQTDETTTTDDEDDEHMQLKSLKPTNEQIEAPVEEDEDEEEQPDEVKQKFFFSKEKKIQRKFCFSRKKNIMKNYKNSFMDNSKK
jgi:hypothetical protein